MNPLQFLYVFIKILIAKHYEFQYDIPKILFSYLHKQTKNTLKKFMFEC